MRMIARINNLDFELVDFETLKIIIDMGEIRLTIKDLEHVIAALRNAWAHG